MIQYLRLVWSILKLFELDCNETLLNYDKPWYPLASQTEQIMSIRMIHAHVCPSNLKNCQRENCLTTIMGEVLDPSWSHGKNSPWAVLLHIQHFTFTFWNGLRSYCLWLWHWHCLWLWHRWWHLLRCLLRRRCRWDTRSCLLWNTCAGGNKKSSTRSKPYGPWKWISHAAFF